MIDTLPSPSVQLDAGPWGSPDLPQPAPLAMPVQDLGVAPRAAVLRPEDPAMLWRRAALIGGSATIGLVASCGVAARLAIDGFDLIDQLYVLLSLALFTWLAFGFLTALVGFVLLRTARGPQHDAVPARPRGKVAILCPVYNEELEPLARRLGRMSNDLAALDVADAFDFFVLSDSDPRAETAEQAMCYSLRREDGCAFYYRRRTANVGRKPGNIADWITRFGAAYPSMLVLDADSLMAGDVILRLANALEADPGVALIQTNPQLTAARTLFARWQQFSSAFGGPVASAGLAWWSGDEATFWGHNAIVRTAAFAGACGLPHLPGAEPLGGAILSHDMVEAALLRRRGWRTRLMLLDEGSYEESPPTMIDHAIRDRRWCQGNLQHLKLLETAGLHWISRLQLLMGASAYLTSPMWLLVLAGGLFEAIRSGTPMANFGPQPWLVALTVLLLFGPRLLALACCLHDAALVRRLGGWRAILPSIFADVALSIAVAPAMMASQCRAIVEIMGGQPSGWSPQRRHSDGIDIGEALDRYRWHLPIGLLFWTVSLSELGGGIWSLPVALGLLGSPLLAVATSRASLGRQAARLGVFSMADSDATHLPATDVRTPDHRIGWRNKRAPARGRV